MVVKGIKGRICCSINRFAIDNNKYMKDYDKNKELSYLIYQNVNNLYVWTILRKLLVNNLKLVENFENFIKNYNEKSDETHFIQANVDYVEKLHEGHNDLPFLTEMIKI